MTTNTDISVLIAGGGPVGLTLALTLASFGVSCRVAERNEGPTRHPKMDITNSRSMELFRKIGVADALRAAAAGGGFAVLSAPSDSPTVQRMKERLRSEVSGSRWYDYSPTGRDNEQEGLRLLFGGAYRAVPDFGAARTVLCLDAEGIPTVRLELLTSCSTCHR